MAGITIEQAQAQLALYLEAEAKILAGQAWELDTPGGRKKLTRADLAAVQSGITIWDDRVKQLTNRVRGHGRTRTMYVRG
jgi:hypothetical protein